MMRGMRLLPAALLAAATLLPAPPAAALGPFMASYEAWYGGRRAGTATMQATRTDAAPNGWRVELSIRGNRGFAGIVGLNIDQSTVFDVWDERYRPISQSTVRRAAVFFNRRITGTYDWHTRTARWEGDISEKRRAPIPLQDGDMSGLLVNLATVRDAAPGRELRYRLVDGGKARDHHYRVSDLPETVTVDDLGYEALRVERTNGGNDETVFWIADGVPTPVRILQRENGEDSLDLRLVEYRGVDTQ